MVRRSMSQRFAAVALVGGLIVTFFAPVEAPAQSGEGLKPPGLCTKERHQHLQDVVDATKKRVSACSSPLDTVEEMSKKIEWFREAIMARELINRECFGTADPGHKQQVSDLGRGMAKCEKLRTARKKHLDRCK